MSADNFDIASFFGRDSVVAEVVQLALDADADARLARSQLLEGPARRGKSWVLRGVYEQLKPQRGVPDLQSQDSSPPPVLPGVACLFTSQQIPLTDYHAAVAVVWDALLGCVPGLPAPQSLAPTDPEDLRLQKLRDYLVQRNADWTRLIEVAIGELEQMSVPVYLVILVDGLDEIDPAALDRFEFEFLERLFSCARVRLVATRRSEVITHGWRRTLIKRHTRARQLIIFPLSAARAQVDDLFKRAGSPLCFDDLSQCFNVYGWQNPGANAIFVRQALDHSSNSRPVRISSANIAACVLELAQSKGVNDYIDGADLAGLRAVVGLYPTIDLQPVSRRLFNQPLGGVGDNLRDLWLGRLQRRGIILVDGRDRFRVHEEFVALCRE